MPPVTVRILHPEPDPAPGRSTRWVADGAGRRWPSIIDAAFVAAGAADVAIVGGPPDDRSFGDRLRELVARRSVRPGSSSSARARSRWPRPPTAGRSSRPRRPTGDGRSPTTATRRTSWRSRGSRPLADIPDLPGDNALPRWLAEVAGYEVDDLRRRWRLAIDIDGPLDLVLVGGGRRGAGGRRTSDRRSSRGSRPCARSPSDPRAELLVAGRTSSATLAWLERHSAARTRAWVEERGLRAASRLAQGARRGGDRPAPGGRDAPAAAGPSSGRSSTATVRARSATISAGSRDAAIVDSRVLLAHRVGADGGRLARRRGSVRVRPAARRAHRRSVAARARPRRPRRRRSRSCSVATRWSARASGSSSAATPGRTAWR